MAELRIPQAPHIAALQARAAELRVVKNVPPGFEASAKLGLRPVGERGVQAVWEVSLSGKGLGQTRIDTLPIRWDQVGESVTARYPTFDYSAHTTSEALASSRVPGSKTEENVVLW